MKTYKKWSTIALFFLLIPSQSWAYKFVDYAQRKQVAKDAKRWSLSEWLDQKSRIGLMDSWLMFNAPSPYEFFFGGDTATVERTLVTGPTETKDSLRMHRGYFGAFVTIVGLYGEYKSVDKDYDQWKALFLLRLLGSSDQSTNFTVHYGLMNRSFENNDQVQHQVGGGKIDLYLLKALALTGMYEYIIEAQSEQGVDMKGSRVEGGLHLEYGALRVYGSWFQETIDRVDSLNVQSEMTREGIQFGLRLYF